MDKNLIFVKSLTPLKNNHTLKFKNNKIPNPYKQLPLTFGECVIVICFFHKSPLNIKFFNRNQKECNL